MTRLKVIAFAVLFLMVTGLLARPHEQHFDVTQAAAAASVSQTAVYASAGDGDSSCTTSFASNTSIGDLLVDYVACNSFPSALPDPFVISNIGLWTWTQIGLGYQNDFSEAAIYVGIAQSASKNIQVTGCTGTYICIAQDFSGGPTAIIEDGLGTGTGGISGQTITPPSYTTSNANDLIFAMVAHQAASTAATPGSPWAVSTAAAGGIGGAGQMAQGIWQAAASATTVQPAWGTASGQWAAAVGAIHASATPYPTPAWVESGH